MGTTTPSAPEPILLSVHFWLAPHLHDYVRSLCTTQPYKLDQLTQADAFATLVRGCLTTRQPRALAPDFTRKRQRYTILITQRGARRYGTWVTESRMRWLETVLQQQLYARLHAHTHAHMACGRRIHHAVQAFTDQHDIGAEHFDIPSYIKMLRRGTYGFPPLAPRTTAP